MTRARKGPETLLRTLRSHKRTSLWISRPRWSELKSPPQSGDPGSAAQRSATSGVLYKPISSDHLLSPVDAYCHNRGDLRGRLLGFLIGPTRQRRKVRFGAFVPQGWRMDLVGVPPDEHWATILRVAGQIESSGYESIWVYDHFHTVPQATQEPTFEAWSLMAALAAATDTARLGQMCTCNSYRHPAYLAKVAATVDVISDGRLEFAIGAGWYEEEYLAYGYPFPSAGTRIAQLREAVEIIKAMWTVDEASYSGEHYSIDGAITRPKPIQKPHPPLWIAGGGERKTLRVVAEHADYSNFGASPDHFEHKSKILREHCDAIGRDFDEIRRTAILHAVLAGSGFELDQKIDRVAAHQGRAPEQVRRQMVCGEPQDLIDRLGELSVLGCAHVQIFFPDSVWGDGLEMFAAEVIPALV